MTPPPIHQALRSATADDHRRVDALFSRFDLGDRKSYGDFIVAQARAVLPIEEMLMNMPGLPAWRPRRAALWADLAELGRGVPTPIAQTAPSSEAAALGMLYVLEGSRLGGAILATQVAPDLPRKFLDQRHLKGEWRAFLDRLNACAARSDGWLAEATRGAKAAFGVFECAGRQANAGSFAAGH